MSRSRSLRDASDWGAGLDASTLALGVRRRDPVDDGATYSASHSFSEPGTYVVTLRAKDLAGNESEAQKSITVEAPDSPVTGGGIAAGGRDRSRPSARAEEAAARQGQAAPSSAAHGRAGRVTLTLRLSAREEGVLTADGGPRAGRDDAATAACLRGLKRGTYAVRIAFKAAGGGYTATGSRQQVVFRK